MTEPSGAARSRSRLVRVLRRLSRRRSSGSFFIFIERRLAGPGDLVREALVGGLAGAVPVKTADLRVQNSGLGMGVIMLVVTLQAPGWEACAHLERPGCLPQLSLAVGLGAPVLGVWGPPLGWGCTRSHQQAPHCQVPPAPHPHPLTGVPLAVVRDPRGAWERREPGAQSLFGGNSGWLPSWRWEGLE